MSSISIDTTGNLKFVYNDRLAALLEEGTSRVSRASHVEPTGYGTWIADLSPVDGPTLGPFKLRREALTAEVDWLEANVIGGA
jgi:hypothetical protein